MAIAGTQPAGTIYYRLGYTRVLANVVDPQNPPDQKVLIPGLKPAVWDFAPTDDGDPSEVDAFNEMIRGIRDQGPAAQTGSR
jgi:hypothetical protein